MKNFHFDGPTWAFLTAEQMYGEEGKLRRAHKHIKNSDIYFLSIMRKCVFDVLQTKVSLNGTIKCEVLVGDPDRKIFERLRVSYPISAVSYSMPHINASFKSHEDFLFYALLKLYKPKTVLKRKNIHIFVLSSL